MDTGYSSLKCMMHNLNVIGKDIDEVTELLAPDVSVTRAIAGNACFYAGHICLYVDNDSLVQTVY